MKVKIEFEDIGSKSVAMTSEVHISTEEQERNQLTPAAVLALATRALYESGVLAQIGQKTLQAVANDQSPVDFVKEEFGGQAHDTKA